MTIIRHPGSVFSLGPGRGSREISPQVVIPGLTRNLYKLILCVCALVLVILVGVRYSLIPPISQKSASIFPTFSTDFAYDNRTFLPAIARFPITSPCRVPSGCPSVPSVLVLPHHLTASPLIARGISLLAINAPKTVIILSPNHANTGQCDITSSKNNWNTSFGQVTIDQGLLNSFLESKTVCEDDGALAVEHGIAGLLPFIKYYLPNTKIVPLALKKDLDPILFNSFTQKLIFESKDSVILASIDFSHGLSQKEALIRDSVTEKLISSLDYPGILKLSSEYLDSPATLISILKILESNKNIPYLLAHTDSSFYNGLSQEVTSYFLITGGVASPSPTIRHSGLDPESIPSPSVTRELKSENNTFTLLFAGDVMLGRSVNTRILKYADFSWPFRKISSLLSEADLTMVNLESPFRSGCQPTDKGMVFSADPRSVEGLKTAGIDIVNLANNHINNQGQEGINETIDILNKNNIVSVGALRAMPVPITVKNTQIAFLGFTDIASGSKDISTASEDNIKKQISEAKKVSDLVIVTFHWGNEYSKRSLHQMDLAHLAIDSGADLVIGHHPHWVQEVEEYKGKPIYYSLGNLVFDQMWSEETRKGLIVKITYSGTELLSQEQIPIKIFDYGQPALVPSP